VGKTLMGLTADWLSGDNIEQECMEARVILSYQIPRSGFRMAIRRIAKICIPCFVPRPVQECQILHGIRDHTASNEFCPGAILICEGIPCLNVAPARAIARNQTTGRVQSHIMGLLRARHTPVRDAAQGELEAKIMVLRPAVAQYIAESWASRTGGVQENRIASQLKGQPELS
jgi:hypothetical protein